MSTSTQSRKSPGRTLFMGLERAVLGMSMWLVAVLLERRVIRTLRGRRTRSSDTV